MKEQPKKQGRFPKKFYTVAAILCACVFLVCAGVLVNDLLIQPAQSDRSAGTARSLYREPEGKTPSSQSNPTVSLAALQKVNPDVEGWITVPGTVIDYPVVCAPKSNEDYYLTHDWQKKDTKYGSIFSIGSAQPAAGENRILFGHSMRDGRMFAALLKFGSLDFYRSSPVFSYQDETGKAQWKVFAVIKTNTDPSQGEPFNYLKTSFVSPDDFLGFLYQVRIRSTLTTPVDLCASDEILTLSTCSYEFDGFRTVVFARRVRTGESAAVDTAKAAVNAQALYTDCWYKKYGGKKPSFPSFAEARQQGKIPWLVS